MDTRQVATGWRVRTISFCTAAIASVGSSVATS
jgi:hypothetical protein